MKLSTMTRQQFVDALMNHDASQERIESKNCLTKEDCYRLGREHGYAHGRKSREEACRYAHAEALSDRQYDRWCEGWQTGRDERQN